MDIEIDGAPAVAVAVDVEDKGFVPEPVRCSQQSGGLGFEQLTHRAVAAVTCRVRLLPK
jgi:hypothetical protein